MNSDGDGSYRSLGRYISHLHMGINQYLHKELEPYGIGAGQFHFLICLYKRDGISQEELTERLTVDKATTTRAIGKLEKEGYVIREKDPSDRRKYRVWLTPKAIDLRPKVKRILKQWTSGILVGFDSDEREILFDFLERMEKNSEGM